MRLTTFGEIALVLAAIAALLVIFKAIAWIERDPGKPTDLSQGRRDG